MNYEFCLTYVTSPKHNNNPMKDMVFTKEKNGIEGNEPVTEW